MMPVSSWDTLVDRVGIIATDYDDISRGGVL